MLVLSRKKNESIVINDDITILVVEIRGDKVRLGIEAPKEVPVHRREVFDAIHRNEEKKDDDDDSSQGKGAPLPNPTPSSPPTSAGVTPEKEIEVIHFPLFDTRPQG